MSDPVTIATTAISLLDRIIQALKQDKPNVAEARALVNQLQQHIDELRTRNLQLERDVLNLEKQNFQLQKQVEREDTWRHQVEKLERCQTPHGKWVFREKGTIEPMLCPNCLNERQIMFLQQHDIRLPDHAPRLSISCHRCKGYF